MGRIPTSQLIFGGEADPEWTEEELLELEERKRAFIDQVQSLGHEKRLFSSVSIGDRLAEHVLGPHSLASFATEWRAYPMTVWGGMRTGPTTVSAMDLGYTEEMAGFEGDERMERTNPELTDRRLLRTLTRPPPAQVGEARGHGARLWVRRLDGSLGPRLRLGLGGRVG